MAMNADAIVREFGNSADAEGVAEIFDDLGTYQRPESPGDGRSFDDWVLIRRNESPREV